MAPVELTRPTILSVAAIICYSLAMLFHLIAYGTDNWSSLLLEGRVRWRVGLWRGCRHNVTMDTWHCSKDVFQDPVFQSGAEWHTGSQVMMTVSLVVLFLLEFAVVGYACIKSMEPFKDKLVGCILTFSLTSAACTFIVLVLYGGEVGKVASSEVKASFGMVIISFFLQISIPIIVWIDKTIRFPKKQSKLKQTLTKSSSSSKVQGHTAPYVVNDNVNVTIMPVSMRTSATSLTEAETYKRFARSEDAPDSANRMPAAMRTSATSLTEAETYKKFARTENPDTSVTGSRGSMYTQSTMFTNVDPSSIESVL